LLSQPPVIASSVCVWESKMDSASAAATLAAENRRQPADCASWTEIFINHAAAACSSFAEAVASGHSLLLIHRLASIDEVDALLSAAQTSAEKIRAGHSRSNLSGSLSVTLACRLEQPVAASCTAGRVRMPVATFHRAIRELCDSFLLRAIELVGSHMPQIFCGGDLAAELLRRGAAPQRLAVAESPLLSFTHNEPAINVYTEGGEFPPHRDLQQLTVLVPLTDSDAFSGGGTAFWRAAAPTTSSSSSPLSTDSSDAELQMGTLPPLPSELVDRDVASAPPAVVLSPPRGSALIWTGNVTHAGLPLSAGQRAVLVASCSRKPAHNISSDE
jgi:hypothetical protein